MQLAAPRKPRYVRSNPPYRYPDGIPVSNKDSSETHNIELVPVKPKNIPTENPSSREKSLQQAHARLRRVFLKQQTQPLVRTPHTKLLKQITQPLLTKNPS